jgi:sugar lactone lactonase YvrE
VYVADNGNHVIRKITSAGVVSTLSGVAMTSGYMDGTGLTAKFNTPTLLALDTSSNLYVADQVNQLIRKISPLGVVSTFAGVAGSDGYADGTATTAKFYNPYGVAVDAGGNVYVTEYNNHLIRKITPSGVVSTVAGAELSAAYVDGTGTAARFNNPNGVAVDTSGNLYLADYNNFRIRKITPIF